MYCKKCGSPIPDDSRFCNYCGTSVSPVVQQPTVPQSSMANQQAPQNPTANQQAPQNPMANQQVPQSQFFQQANPQPPVPKKKKKKTGLIILILVLVVLLAAGAVGAMFLLNRDKKDETADEFENINKVVTEYYNASNQCDADLMLNLVPKAYQDYFMEEYDLDNSSLKKAVQDYLEDHLETLEEVRYGNNIKTNVTVKYIQELNKSDVDNMKSWHNKATPLKVEACYACKLVVNTKGDNKDDTFEKNQTIIKVDGKWYSQDALEFVSLAVAKDD